MKPFKVSIEVQEAIRWVCANIDTNSFNGEDTNEQNEVIDMYEDFLVIK